MKKSNFFSHIEAARQSSEYKNYLKVREVVFRMLENEPVGNDPSRYWSQELAGFEYMFDASPLIIQNLRHHCYHISGLREYDYRDHHAYKIPAFEKKLRTLQAMDKNGVEIPEAPELGGYGHLIDGKRYNIDTLKFYENFIALDRFDILDQFRNTDDRKIVLEIGGGWGGFAYQFKTLFPNVTYINVDLPGSLLFAGTYLTSLFPHARTFFVDGKKESVTDIKPRDYDFIFIPHYLWDYLSFDRPDLVINMASFMEMTTAQVDGYIGRAKKWGAPQLYSRNRDRSQNNTELTTVSSILEKYYGVREVVLDTDPRPMSLISNMRHAAISFKRHLFNGASKQSAHTYRHLLGTEL